MNNEVHVMIYGGSKNSEEIRLNLYSPTAREIQDTLISVLTHDPIRTTSGMTLMIRGIEAEFVVLVLGVLVQRNVIGYKNLWFEVDGKKIRMDKNGNSLDRWPNGFFDNRMTLLLGRLIGEEPSNDQSWTLGIAEIRNSHDTSEK